MKDLYSFMKMPVLLTIIVAIFAVIAGFFLDNFLMVFPIIIVCFFSFLLSSFLNNRGAKKLYENIYKAKNGENIDLKYLEGNKYYKKIFMMFQDEGSEGSSTAEAYSTNHNELNASLQKAYSLSEKSYSEIGTIFESLDEISEPVNQQAEDLQTIADRINNLSEYIDSIHNNFGTILSSTDQINNFSSSGLNSIVLLQQKFDVTSTVFDDIFTAVKDFTTIINNINDFVEIIKNIGKQTSLLALNASIEASRAGTAGKGFIVVANEFKELSLQTEEYTTDISNMIENVSQQYHIITTKVDKLRSSIQEQRDSVKETDKVFNNIVNNISEISKEMTDISTSLSRMKEDKDAVFASIENTAALSQETAASSEEFASTIAYHIQTITDIFEAIKKAEKLLPEDNDNQEKYSSENIEIAEENISENKDILV